MPIHGNTQLGFSRNSSALRDMTLLERAKLTLTAHREIDTTTGCWLWTGAKLPTGHGQTRIHGKCYLVHRLSAMIYLSLDITNRLVGSRKDKSQGNHKCGNTSCFNPDHLYIGTQADNLSDIPVTNRGGSKMGKRLPCLCHRGHLVTVETYRKNVGCLICQNLRMQKRSHRISSIEGLSNVA